jgi:hypothetical protein
METRDVEIAFAEEMAILSLFWLVICDFMVTSLWSWVVAARLVEGGSNFTAQSLPTTALGTWHLALGLNRTLSTS